MKYFLSMSRQLQRYSSFLAIFALISLAGCGTTADSSSSAAPAQPIIDLGLKAQPLKWSRSQPGCTEENECPQLTVDILQFPEDAQLTALIEQELIMLNLFESEQDSTFNSLLEYEQFFWANVQAHDQSSFFAKIHYKNERFTVLELVNGVYFTGAAHGMSITEFLNWDNATQTVITLEDILEPDTEQQFYALLASAHHRWLTKTAEIDDIEISSWLEMWPFHANDNIALTASGVVVKYNSYAIGPYSFGHPELTIPYEQLGGILKPEYLPLH